MAAGTLFSGNSCCGEVAVVEWLKKNEYMDCLPEPNRVTAAERWLSVEVRLCAMHLTKYKTLNDFFLLYPPVPLYICAHLIFSGFCFARVLDHPVRSTVDLHRFITSFLIRSC